MMPPAHAGLRGRAAPWPLALLLGGLALLLASLACTPSLDLTGDLGRAYADLAADPLATHPHPVPGRIFTAAVSWLVGLRGADVVWTMLAACLLLPVVVARWALGRGRCPGEALLAATAVSATLVVRTTLHYGGYPDAVTYLGLLAVWLLRRRPIAVTIAWLLTVLDHERALLMLPWALVMVSGWGEDPAPEARAQRRRAWFGLLLATVAATALHLGLEARRVAEHDAESYLAPLLARPLRNLETYGVARPVVGLASAFQWVWLVPAVWAVARLRSGRWRPVVAQLGLPLLAVAASMLLAYDWSRLATLAFPCLLPALAAGLASDQPRTRWLLVAVVALQVMTPQWFTAAHVVERMGGWALPW
jgi:hypothetical protein